MAKNDLNQSLHGKLSKRRSPRLPVIAPILIFTALALAIMAGFWVAVVDDPDGGRAVAVAAIEAAAPASTGSLVGDAASEGGTTEAIAAGAELAALPHMPTPLGADAGLVEQSAFGPLPRVSPDGRRARDAYARPAGRLPDGVPRIVMVVGGLGISQTGTQNAIELLPEDVTLAFAPYGFSLQRWGAKAREEGHEILLQIPLEPEGYPQENPGEHTLLASASGDSRRDLHWVLSRLTGYAGVMNYMGARFTAEERALVPFLGEVGERGLFYVDDGSSAASLAPAVGEGLRVPVLTADRIVDQDRSAAEIERNLTELEAIAGTRGVAVGVASAFPASVEAIARWARGTKERGVFIVPASAALAP
jgi:polysaccharide deacetylase 2 family uncharacterized protein YibQ